MLNFLVSKEMAAVKIFPGELIGKKVIIIAASDHRLVGLEGKIIDETKSTLKISEQGKTKVLLKSAITFRLLEGGQVISGKGIAKKPEDRLKGK